MSYAITPLKKFKIHTFINGSEYQKKKRNQSLTDRTDPPAIKEPIRLTGPVCLKPGPIRLLKASIPRNASKPMKPKIKEPIRSIGPIRLQ